MGSAPVVVVESLTKRFGSVNAVTDLSFALEAGTVTGFLGPNGAGKTTTLRMLLGLSMPTSGRALVFDKAYPALERPSHRIGAVLEATDFHPGRSGRNHLRMLSRSAGIPDARVEQVLKLVELDDAANRRVKGYSLGMRQRLGLASALLGDPDLLILDEPANGLDPEGVRWLRDFLRSYAAGGRTVLVSSHVLAEVAQTVDHVLIVAKGRLIVESPLAELTSRVGGSVRVRSPQVAELQMALARAGSKVAPSEDGALVVNGMPIERVGEIAASANVVLHELVMTGVSLEEIFLELTSSGEDEPGQGAVMDQIRGEILKIRSTRTTLGLIAGMLVLTIALTVLSGTLQHPRDLASAENQRQLLGIGSIAGLFAALAGILMLTSEYRFGTIRPTFLVAPSWKRILGAKFIATFVVGIVFAVAATAISYGIGYACLSGRDIPLALDHEDVATLVLGTIIGTGIWGAIGVAFASIVRNQVGAVIGILAWGFVIENLLFGLVPSVGRYVPGEAANALQGSTADHLLSSPGLGGLVLLAWFVGLAVIGLVWTQRRDVP